MGAFVVSTHPFVGPAGFSLAPCRLTELPGKLSPQRSYFRAIRL